MDDEQYIDNIKNMSENEVRLRARSKTRYLEEELEKKAKRIKPEKFVTSTLNFFRDPSQETFIAPHTMLQAIEANCAYHKGGYDEDITWGKFADIINLTKRLEDENDFYLWSISHNLGIFFNL